MKKVLIFKNDRIGDLFTSTKALKRIINKHYSDKIIIYFSHQNIKFSFLFPNIEKLIISMKLTLLEKIKIFLYFLTNRIENVYILKPRNFYFILPFFFRNIKFYGVTIKQKNKNRPSLFLQKFLFKKATIDRTKIGKRRSTYKIQEDLIENINNDLVSLNYNIDYNPSFELPNKYIYFHYKDKLFRNDLGWSFDLSIKFIEYISKFSNNLVFSSEINNEKINTIFKKKFITYDYNNKTIFNNNTNNKKIIFLKDIDGKDLYSAIKYSEKVIAPEGMASHMAFFLKKEQLALTHYTFKNKDDYFDQLVSCKEWFPPKNFKFTVLKKDYQKSINKIYKRLVK